MPFHDKWLLYAINLYLMIITTAINNTEVNFSVALDSGFCSANIILLIISMDNLVLPQGVKINICSASKLDFDLG